MGVSDLNPGARERRCWNADNMVGAKRPLKPRDVWAIRFFLDEHSGTGRCLTWRSTASCAAATSSR